MDNEMEIGAVKRLFKDASKHMVPTLGPKIYICYLHWAISILGATR